MQLFFGTRGPDLVITNFYAPHTWTNRETIEEVKEKRMSFHNTLNEVFIESSQGKFHIGCGDAHIRIQGRQKNEEDVIGPHVLGRGDRFVKQLSTDDREQRNMFIASLRTTGHVFGNCFPKT